MCTVCCFLLCGSVANFMADVASMVPVTALQGPEIRTGFLKNPDQPVKLTAGKEITITTDYEFKGDDDTIAMRYLV